MNAKQIQWWRGRSPAPIGTLYTKSTWSDLSDFTNSGSTVSVVGNALQFSGGVGTFTQNLDISAYGYTCLEQWKITATVKVGSKAIDSYGFGFGIRSLNATFGAGCAYHVIGRFAMTTGLGSTDGSVIINSGTSYTQTAQSAGQLTFSVNDLIQIIVQRNKHTMTVTASNLTTSSSSISCSYTYTTFPNAAPYLANTGKFSIFSLGGTFTIQSILVDSLEKKNSRIVLIGDSKTVGYDSTSLSNRFAEIIAATIGASNVVVSAGGSDGLVDHLNRVNEIKSLVPFKYVICGASNDIRNGVPSGTINTNYASLVSQLLAVAPVIHTTGLKETMSQASLQTYINANYSAANIIDTLGTTLSLDTDTIHPLDAGHSTFAGLLTASGKL